MKSLNEFINTSRDYDNYLLESIINESGVTVQDVYEHIFDEMFTQYQINEGFFGKIGKWAANLGKKAEKGGENLDKKIDQLSDAGKKAVASAKEKAGNAWDKMKGVYVNTVSAIDNAIEATKGTIADLAEKFKMKKDELEALLANACANAMEKGSEIGKKLQEWTADGAKFAAQMAASAAIVSAAKIAMTAGYNSSMIIDLLDAAGVN